MSGWCFNRFVFVGSDEEIDKIEKTDFLLTNLFPNIEVQKTLGISKEIGPIEMDRENIKINNKMFQKLSGDFESTSPNTAIIKAVKNAYPGIFRLRLEYIDPISKTIGVWSHLKGVENDERLHYIGNSDLNKIARQIQHSLYLEYEPFIQVMARLHKP